MIPVAFEYVRAESVDHALEQLSEHGDEAKLLAGGHSLLPMMKLRLAVPSVLVDVGRLNDLSYIRHEGDTVKIGALTTHHLVETSELLAEYCPLIKGVAAEVGDPQVRHRGTLGGTLAHADPASDLPAAVLALGGTMVVAGPKGQRRIAATNFFTGYYESALAPDEMIVEIELPATPGGKWSFKKFNRRAQDWAIVAVAAVHNGTTGVGLVNMGATPLRATAVEEAIAAGANAKDAAAQAAQGTSPTEDLNATVEYRAHLARVLTERALNELQI